MFLGFYNTINLINSINCVNSCHLASCWPKKTDAWRTSRGTDKGRDAWKADYASINIQYSRGCPFNCEFCDITLLCGRTPRTKDKGQIIREIESVYASGFRGQVFFVDDNFIGNKKKKKAFRFRPNYFGAFFRSLVVLGVVGKERFHYWRLLLWTVISRPRLLPQAVTLSIYGFHFRKIFEKRLSWK